MPAHGSSAGQSVECSSGPWRPGSASLWRLRWRARVFSVCASARYKYTGHSPAMNGRLRRDSRARPETPRTRTTEIGVSSRSLRLSTTSRLALARHGTSALGAAGRPGSTAYGRTHVVTSYYTSDDIDKKLRWPGDPILDDTHTGQRCSRAPASNKSVG